ncbi:hypothetical protein NEDG_02003 [Nematocida displodere]|uniref:Signal recognition particle subunit SRP72 n=1 Tax=Nematocida displodere TaxID=1805483 RepID=A0A177EG40_9MICR|nr:hypothetical protein NEDG_02003 [Nematocida displodere]
METPGERGGLERLLQEKRYQEILEHKEASEEDKVVSLIKLEEFAKALGRAKNNTVAKAYCYYKLKKYQACLKTAGRKESEEWSALRMQALFALDRYDEAVNEGRTLNLTRHTLVNYAAALALAHQARPVYSAELKECRKMVEAEADLLLREEGRYNLALAVARDGEAFVSALREIHPTEKDTLILVNAQINNSLSNFEKIDTEHLSKRNRAIVEYNHHGRDRDMVAASLKKWQEEIFYQNELKRAIKGEEPIAAIKDVLAELPGNPEPLRALIRKLSPDNLNHLTKLCLIKASNPKDTRKTIRAVIQSVHPKQ